MIGLGTDGRQYRPAGLMRTDILTVVLWTRDPKASPAIRPTAPPPARAPWRNSRRFREAAPAWVMLPAADPPKWTIMRLTKPDGERRRHHRWAANTFLADDRSPAAKALKERGIPFRFDVWPPPPRLLGHRPRLIHDDRPADKAPGGPIASIRVPSRLAGAGHRRYPAHPRPRPGTPNPAHRTSYITPGPLAPALPSILVHSGIE